MEPVTQMILAFKKNKIMWDILVHASLKMDQSKYRTNGHIDVGWMLGWMDK